MQGTQKTAMSEDKTDESRTRVKYRDPYPPLREKLYWSWVKYATTRDVPPKSWVQLSCPESGDVIATEHTEPLEIERDVKGGTGIYTYDCSDCGSLHRFLWGPPAPLRLIDATEEESHAQ